MTASDHNSDPLPISREDAVVILEQADLAVQAGAPLAVGLRAMASEATPKYSLVLLVALTLLALVGLALLPFIGWSPFLSALFATSVAFCVATLCFNLLTTYRQSRSQEAIRAMARSLDEGEPLPRVLQSLGSQVSPLMLTLIKHGAELGRFDTALHWAAEQGRRRRSLHWTLWFALSYPLFLLGVGGAVSSFLMIGIVPDFKKIFDDFGTELPGMTKVIIAISNFQVNYWWIVVGAILVAVIAAFVVTLTTGDWLVTRKWSPFIPVIGPLFHLETLSEFCDLLAVFVECQMPIPKTLRMASMATQDQWLQSACETLATDIDEGHGTETSARTVGIPVAISQLLREGSDSQTMAESLRGLSDLYASRVEVSSRLVAIVAEPFVVLVTAVGLGSTVVALYLPLIKLLNDLS